MHRELTKAQQEYVDTIIEAENATKYRRISPGAASCCGQCRSDFGLEENDPAWKSLSDEGGFSWYACEVCRSHLGGNRYAAHGFDANDEVIHYSICGDCLFYLANGDVPERPE